MIGLPSNHFFIALIAQLIHASIAVLPQDWRPLTTINTVEHWSACCHHCEIFPSSGAWHWQLSSSSSYHIIRALSITAAILLHSSFTCSTIKCINWSFSVMCYILAASSVSPKSRRICVCVVHSSANLFWSSFGLLFLLASLRAFCKGFRMYSKRCPRQFIHLLFDDVTTPFCAL